MKSRKESIVIDIPVDAIQYRHQVQLPDKVAASIRASILVEDPELHTLTSHIFNPSYESLMSYGPLCIQS